MKAKVYFALVTLVCAICCALTLGACNAHTHDYNAEWSTDEVYHWHECKNEGCDNKYKDKEAHYDDNHDGECDACFFVMTSSGPALESISLTPGELVIDVGDEYHALPTVAFHPENARHRSVRWTSSDPETVYITDAGIKGLRPGSATLTADCEGKTDICSVTVRGGGGASFVTEEMWSAALNKNAFTRFTATIATGSVDLVLKADMASHKYYYNNTSNEEIYYSLESDKYYKYVKGARDEKFVRTESTQADFEKYVLLEQMMFLGAADKYADFSFDPYAGNYRATNIEIFDIMCSDVRLTFSNGKLTNFSVVMGTDTINVDYVYSAVVTLPSDFNEGGQGGDDDEDGLTGKYFKFEQVIKIDGGVEDDYIEYIESERRGALMTFVADGGIAVHALRSGETECSVFYTYTDDETGNTVIETGDWQTFPYDATFVLDGDEIFVQDSYVRYVYKLHTHSLDRVPAKESTCSKKGNAEYYTCGDCVGLFSDAQGKNMIIDKASLSIAKKAHTFVGDVCSVCQGRKPTEGLRYSTDENEPYAWVEDVGTADCTDIIVIAEEYNGKPVEYIGTGAFSYRNITSLIIPDSVKWIDCAFTNSRFTSLTIPDSIESVDSDAFGSAYAENVYYLGDLATWCSIRPGLQCGNLYINGQLLTEAIIPDSVTSIDHETFWMCDSITSVYVPESLTNIADGAFYNLSNLTSITVSENNPEYSALSGILYNKEKTDILCVPQNLQGEVILPGTLTEIIGYSGFSNVTKINFTGDLAAWCDIDFSQEGNPLRYTHDLYINDVCVTQGELIIPETVTDIKANTFRECTGITKVILHDNIRSISNEAFVGCDNISYNIDPVTNYKYWGSAENPYLALMDASRSDTCAINENAKIICDYAFFNSDMSEIIIPDNITAIGDNAFRFCDSLTNIEIGGGVTTIGKNAFAQCSLLESITIPANVQSIGDDAFELCNALKTINLNEGLRKLGSICYLNSLTSISVPSTVTEIGDICGCNNLVSVSVPETLDVSHITFEDCASFKGLLKGNIYLIGSKLTGVTDGVEYVVVPNTITSVAAGAFDGADVKYVYLPSSVTTIEQGAFDGANVKVFFEASVLPANAPEASSYVNAGKCTADGWIYTPNDGGTGVCIVAYIGAGGQVVVPSDLGPDSEEVMRLNGLSRDEGVFLCRDDITKITFRSRAMTVGAYTMKGLSNLTDIEFAVGIAQIITSKLAFDSCDVLQRIVLDDYGRYEITILNGESGRVRYDVTSAEDVLEKINLAQNADMVMIMPKSGIG